MSRPAYVRRPDPTGDYEYLLIYRDSGEAVGGLRRATWTIDGRRHHGWGWQRLGPPYGWKFNIIDANALRLAEEQLISAVEN